MTGVNIFYNKANQIQSRTFDFQDDTEWGGGGDFSPC